jgi:Spy/CpxP family protein refolding chaperone
MSEQSNTAAFGSSGPTRPRRARRWLFVTAVALVAAFSGAMATRAVGQYGRPGWGHMHGGPWLMRGPLTPEQIEDRVDRGVRHAAIELDATAEQQEKLRSIAKAVVKDLLPMRNKAQAARERVKGLLTQPKVDRDAIEAFRAEQMALAEAASKRFALAIGDAAEVLTPEQRQKVQEHMEWRRSRWRGWHRG